MNGFASVDKAQGEEFFKFATLHFGGMDVEYGPTSVVIRDISLSDFTSRLIVNADGTLNFQGIVATDGAPANAAAETAQGDAAAPAEAGPPAPVRIDDPQFSVWRIVWKIVGNLLVKAATAPFALIGAMFGGGGEELSFLEFEPGRSDIPAAGAGKLSNLAKALTERPGLKLEIMGHADVERDPEALRQLIFRRKLAAQRVKVLVKAGEPAPAIDNVRIDAAEYPKYLAFACKEEKYPKPRNFIGMAKDLPVPEMEKLMLAHIRVTDGDLRQLAVDRATRVRDALVADGKVESGRIFLVEPKTPGGGEKGEI